MKTEYVQEPDKNYLVTNMEESGSDFSIKMLLENKIDGILPLEKRNFNGDFRFYYDITGKHSLKSRLHNHLMTGEEMRKLFQGFYHVIGMLSSYFLDMQGLVLDISYIYEEKEKLFFCYFPYAEKTERREKILTFAEQLLESIDHEDEKAVLLGYQFYKSAGEENKTILQMLEDTLLQAEPDVLDQTQSGEESKPGEIFSDEEDTEIINDIKIIFSKPDVWTLTGFFFSFFVSLGRLLIAREPILLVFLILSLLGITTGFVDIDIKGKK